MIVVLVAAVILFGIEIISLVNLREEAKEIDLWYVENPIGDAYRYKFVDSDYERVHRELLKFADELHMQYN
ncbi:MAG: hypothetical protein IKW81_00910 [Pseudobutyrivibrio sp.]|nr:hypothetical protein [Pseudobutyrivibrio sp.]